MRFVRLAAAAAIGILAGTAALAQTQVSPSVPPPGPAAPALQTPAAPPAPVAHALTAEDLSAFVDGFVPYAIARGDIAGAEVVVVKDGRILFAKGYGFADVKSRKPIDTARTLFRPGSVSKLFTWTAVMQLEEQGKLDLDKDINTYLDFTIPPAFGKPITLRNLMTHTPGFEETVKNLLVLDPKHRLGLGGRLKAWIPERIFPPGEVSAYSNYGAALAGYIVERVSGEKFEDYVRHHIFTPLGMTHATFDQPLPKSLAPDMATGYEKASAKEIKFELIDLSPAGALSASGEDIARFMVAHLNEGAGILRPETARLMHSDIYRAVPGMQAMGLGFYHEDRNGTVIVGHGGDTTAFHSDLHLILARNVGFYYSQNSGSKPGLGVRAPLFAAFMDRYFPGPAPKAEKELKTAKEDAAKVAGAYLASRRSESSFLRVANILNAVTVTANGDNTISLDVVKDLAGNPKKWREVAPGTWREVNGTHTLAVTMKDGKVARVDSNEIPPIMVLSPVPFWESGAWQVPLLIFALGMLTLTVIFWPLKALLRWRYGSPFALTGRAATLYRLTRVVALIDVVFLGGWALAITLGSEDLDFLTDASDWIWRAFQVVGLVGAIGTIIPALNFFTGLGDATRPWWTKLTDLLILIAAVLVVFFAITLKLFALSLNY